LAKKGKKPLRSAGEEREKGNAGRVNQGKKRRRETRRISLSPFGEKNSRAGSKIAPLAASVKKEAGSCNRGKIATNIENRRRREGVVYSKKGGPVGWKTM